jgi:hypothetical protein
VIAVHNTAPGLRHRSNWLQQVLHLPAPAHVQCDAALPSIRFALYLPAHPPHPPVCRLAAATPTSRRPFMASTRRGVGLLVQSLVPYPSWPRALPPQVYTSPLAVITTECLLAAATQVARTRSRATLHSTAQHSTA